MMAGIRFDTTAVDNKEWFVRLVVPAPTDWFATTSAWVGLGILVAGLVLWMTSLAQPDPLRWVMVISRYPEFAVAGHLLLAAAFLSTIGLSGNVVDAGVGGLSYRSIASVRSMANIIIACVLAALSLAAYVMSFGGSRRLVEPAHV